MVQKIKLYGVKWEVDTAGPSPDCNLRTEVFFFGCARAKAGNPCKGCFNTALWDDSVVTKTYTPKEIAKQISEKSSNKYVTIGGGEPTDQLEELTELCKLLKQDGFHIMIYTWKDLKNILSSYSHPWTPYGEDINPRDFLLKVKFEELLNYVDIVVDGEFTPEERLYDATKQDGLLSSVGSGNQTIWDIKYARDNALEQIKGYAMRTLDGLFLKDGNELIYILKDIDAEERIINLI